MRILICGINYAPEVSGIGPYTAGLARHLDAMGHSVTVITTFPHYPQWQRTVQFWKLWSVESSLSNLRVIRVRHYVPSAGRGIFARLLSEVSFGIVSSVLATARRADAVVTISPALISSALTIMFHKWFRNKVPVGVVVQDIYSRAIVESGSTAGAGNRLVETVERWVLNSCDSISVIHRGFEQTLSAMGIMSSKIVINRNWTHASISVGEVDPAVRARYGVVDPSCCLVVHAGNMGRKQDLISVVSAARLAEELDCNVKFVLVGDGNDRQLVEEAAGSCVKVQIVDPLSAVDFEALLTAADVLLVNERAGMREMAVPSKLTTYFQSGRPVVAVTDADSVTASEVTAAGGGVVVSPGDPKKLLATLVYVKNTRELSASLASNGLKYASEQLNGLSILKDYEAWIFDLAQEMVSENRPKGRLA